MATSSRGKAEVMKRLRLRLAASVLLAVFFALPAFAQSGPTPEELKQRLELWQSLSAERRRQLVERYRAFKALPLEQQLRLKQSFRRWKRMDPAVRRNLLRRWKQYKGLPADRKREFRRRWRVWQSMKAEDRALLRKKYRQFQKLPPDKRRALIERRRLGRPPAVRPFGRPGLPRRPPPHRRSPVFRPRDRR